MEFNTCLRMKYKFQCWHFHNINLLKKILLGVIYLELNHKYTHIYTHSCARINAQKHVSTTNIINPPYIYTSVLFPFSKSLSLSFSKFLFLFCSEEVVNSLLTWKLKINLLIMPSCHEETDMGKKEEEEEKQTWINNMYVRQKKMTPNHTADVSVTPTQ